MSSAGEWVFTDAEAQGGVEAVRHLSRQAVLAPLYRGRRPDAWKENIGGIIFVGIDNSTYQVSPSQHQVLREALASVRADASPTTVGVVLMCHIPLFTPELAVSMVTGGRDVGENLCGNPSANSHAPNVETQDFMETVGGEGAEVRTRCVMSTRLLHLVLAECTPMS